RGPHDAIGRPCGDARTDGRENDAARAADAGAVKVTFEAHHPVRIELVVIAELTAKHRTINGLTKRVSSCSQIGNSCRSGRSNVYVASGPAPTTVGANIKAGPIVNGRRRHKWRRRLPGEIRGGGSNRSHAQDAESESNTSRKHWKTLHSQHTADKSGPPYEGPRLDTSDTIPSSFRRILRLIQTESWHVL